MQVLAHFIELFFKIKKLQHKLKLFFVGPLGLEPRLFWTKTRRVASYTMGHSHNEDANLEQNFVCTNIFLKLIFKSNYY